MSVLQKGVLTVVGATLVASALILFNEKTAAEPESEDRAAIATSLDAQVITHGTLSERKPSSKGGLKSKKIILPPPVGPFQIASPSRVEGSVKLKSKESLLSKAPNAPQKAAFKKSQPSFPAAPDLRLKAPVAPTQEKISQTRPVFSKIKPQPQKITRPKLQPTMPAENKVKPVNTRQQPQQPKQQSQKPFSGNPPVQRYMYVPVPMYQPQFAPQVIAPQITLPQVPMPQILVPQIPVPRVYYRTEPNNPVNAAKNQITDKALEAIKFNKDKVTK